MHGKRTDELGMFTKIKVRLQTREMFLSNRKEGWEAEETNSKHHHCKCLGITPGNVRQLEQLTLLFK